MIFDPLTDTCKHCEAIGTVMPGCCEGCAVTCDEPGCVALTDPAAIGMRCARHIPNDNTLEINDSDPPSSPLS